MASAAFLLVAFLHSVLTVWGQRLLQDHNCTYQNVYMPVCGSDDKDYFNYELLECISILNPGKNLTAKYMYPCACHGVLDSDAVSPVCATNNITYPTRSAFDCTKVLLNDPQLSIIANEVCPGGAIDKCWAEVIPPVLWEPVCGTDEFTYNSIWHLHCENLHSGNSTKVKQKGACPCKISRFFKPLCATNDVTYPNMETFLCDQHLYSLHNVSITREGYCGWSEDSSCEERVSKFDESISNGLCASDGITYLTAQQFKCVRNKNKGLTLRHDGPCKLSEVPKNISPEEACEIESKYPVVAPVCGNDGNSYMSIFSLLCRSSNITNLKLKSDYVCEKDKVPAPTSPCSIEDETVDPLCATNNVTYANPTKFACAASKTKGLLVLHSGECTNSESICKMADDTARMDLPYVCANDGKTYLNLYAFWCTKLKKPDLDVAHFDECV
ncbi:serine protease inhibitor dipetalogastin-like [Periplaneta americana]|uniref:serine protease inhibitor dipetalogastin-like n=1 Tax=Periplaneta americana TaxID=6978 RepID=UPI0037E8528B